MSDTTKSACTRCAMMEQKLKDNPRSFSVRLWKWHSGWCPGYKAYIKAKQADSLHQNPVK